MSVTRDPTELRCPGCGTHNAEGICGIQLMNPVGCEETIVVIRCAGCAAIYLEIEEDGFSHPDGPDYWTRGPYPDGQGYEIIGRVRVCPDPFNRLCGCPSHEFMDDLMYGLFRVSGDTSGSAGDRPGGQTLDESTNTRTPAPPARDEFDAPDVSLPAPAPPGSGVTGAAQLPLFEDDGDQGASPADEDGSSLQESADALLADLREACPDADVQVMVKSMAWARGKLCPPG